MKKTSFTNMFRSLAVLLLVALGVVANAQSVSITNQALGCTSACPGGCPTNTTSYTFNFPSVAPGTNVLGSINLNYCTQSWTSDWDFDIISPTGVITNIVNPTGSGSAGGTVNITLLDQSTCSAAFPLATTALNSVGSYSGTLRSATAFPCLAAGASAGVWQLRVRNIYTSEPAFLMNATLNFVAPPAYTASVTPGAVVGGSVISSAQTSVVSCSTSDTINWTITLTPGSSTVAATAATAAVAPSTTSTNIYTAAGPFTVGRTRIREDEVCYNPKKNVVYMLTVIAPPQVTCPANIVKTLAPGECYNQAAWACPISSVVGAGVGPQFIQHASTFTINDALACGAGFSRYGRLFDAFPAVKEDPCNPGGNNITVRSITAGAWSGAGQTWTLRVWRYNQAAPGAGVCPTPISYAGDMTLVGTSTFTCGTSGAGSAGFTATLAAPIVLQRGVVYYAEINSTAPSFTVGSSDNMAETRCSYFQSDICTIGGSPVSNPITMAAGGFGFIRIPLILNTTVQSNGLEQISGPKQDTLLGPGIYQVCYKVTDATNTTATCCFSYEVRAYSGPISNTLVCNDFLHISLDTLCSAVIGADMLLEGGPYKCYDNYKVEVSTTKNGPWRDNMGCVGLAAQAFNDNKIHICAGAIGKTYYYRVVDKANTTNTCWGQFDVEDKVAPKLVCPADQTIKCNVSLEPGNQPSGATCGAVVNASGASLAAPINVPVVVNLPWNAIIDPTYTFTVVNTGSAWTGDQRAVLISPSGQVIRLNGDQNVLANNVPVGPGVFGCANNGSRVTYSNTSTVSPATLTCANPVVGTCKPLDPLPALPAGPGVCGYPIYGSSVNGTWTLRVWDDFPGDALGNMQGCFNFTSSSTLLPNGLFLGTLAEYNDPTNFGGVNVVGGNNGVNATKIGDKKYRVKAGLVDACTEVTLSYNDVIQEFPCSAASQILKQITRKWSAVDASGNSATCTQKITVTRADLNDLAFPLSWDGQPGNNRVLNICSDFYSGNPTDYRHGDQKWVKLPNGYPSPKAGVNAVDTIYVGEFDPFHEPLNPGTDTLCLRGTGMPSGALCGTINMLYTDTRLDICGSGANAGYKLLRDWRVLDWCTGQIKNYTQVIKVMDMTAPSIACPTDLTASTDGLVCTGSGTFPTPSIVDICSDKTSYEVYYRGGTAFPDGAYVGQNPDGSWRYSGFPCGSYNFKYVAKDECGNVDSCTTFDLIIRDLTVPVPVCRSLSQVTLTNTPDDPYTTVKECGLTRVEAYKFDEGSWDNCGQVYFKARRGNTFTPGIYDNDPRFDDYVWFNCEDVGKDIDVILRVYDVQPLAGHVGSVSDRGDSYRPTRTDGCGPQGNFNDCIVKVRVEDLVNPTIVCPAQVNITCTAYDFSIPLTNVDTAWFNKYFGRIVTSDCGGVFAAGSFTYFNGFGQVTSANGSAFDNCFVSIPQTVTSQMECGVGTITRTFRAVDKGGRQSTPCTQLIVVTNPTPFNINTLHYTDPGSDLADPCDGAERIRVGSVEDFNNDLYVSPNFAPDNIIWPDKVVELPNCTGINGIGTECANTGKDAGHPRLTRNDKCDLVGITHTDEVFELEPNVCVKILRHWTVIDWCQDKVNGRKWYYTQVIKLVDKVAPDFTGNTCKNDTICQYPTDCGPDPVTLTASAKDNCTPDANLKYSYFVDLDNNGTNDGTGIGAGVTITKANGLKYGRHMITWAVEDNCGNVKTCSKIFIVKDCKKPTPVAKLLSIELMPNNCTATLEASKVNNFSWDNCTPMTNLRFRLAKAGEYSANMTLDQVLALNDYVVFTGSEVGTQTIALFAIDADNNWDYVETFVVVQSNLNPDCPGGGGTAPVTTTIQTEQKENVENVDIKINGVSKGKTTNGSDFITMLKTVDLSKGLSGVYTVAPEKLDGVRNGVTTADLVAINKHILGIEPLSSPYKRIAADINNDKKISTADMVELRKLILFISDNFSNNTSWKNVDKSYVFTSQNAEGQNYPLTVTINPLTSATSTNFVGVKIGDVNGSAKSSSLIGDATERSAGTLVFDVQDATVKAGETRTVEFKAQDLANINAYQFTMNFNTEALEVVSVGGLNENNFGLSLLNNGAITLSNDAAAADQVIAVTFKAKQTVQLSNVLSVGSNYTAAEAYTVNGDKFDVALSFNGTIAGNFQLLQNQPNPFNGKTVIGFVLPEASNATLTIFDATGRTLKVVKGDFAKGYNEVVVEKSELNTVGILSYRLTSDKFSATKQMIIAE